MNSMEVYQRVTSDEKSSITDDEWLEMERWLISWIRSNPPAEEKAKFLPLGIGEMIHMKADAIKRKRKMI